MPYIFILMLHIACIVLNAYIVSLCIQHIYVYLSV
jgi:hypothetical protein